MNISEAEINREHYFERSYLKRERLYSLIEQIELVKKYCAPSDTILEVGKGNGFVGHFLEDYLRYKVKSCDVNERLYPERANRTEGNGGGAGPDGRAASQLWGARS